MLFLGLNKRLDERKLLFSKRKKQKTQKMYILVSKHKFFANDIFFTSGQLWLVHKGR